jgi:hypothetical protein
LLNTTLDVARELLFGSGNTTLPDCASLAILDLQGACAQAVRSKQGAEVGTLLQLHVAMQCLDPYSATPCCTGGFQGAGGRVTFFVPASSGAEQAEAVDFEVERFW